MDFEVQPGLDAGGAQFGIVRIEKSTPLRIWDGQHRTLRAYLAVERLTKEISDLLTKISRAKNGGEAEKVAAYEAEIAVLREVRRRLGLIVIPVTITLETDEDRIAELFTDVADNVKGTNATALARLDHRNVFNRVAAAIYEGADEWTLLPGLIDDDNAYVTQNNPNWTTYGDVAAVAQTAWLGYGARWTENAQRTRTMGRHLPLLARFSSGLEHLTHTSSPGSPSAGVGPFMAPASRRGRRSRAPSSGHCLLLGALWYAAGLTNPCYRDGTGGMPLRHPAASGLPGAGYLWGEDMTRVSPLDLGAHIGWASDELVEQLEANMRLCPADTTSLHEAAKRRRDEMAFARATGGGRP